MNFKRQAHDADSAERDADSNIDGRSRNDMSTVQGEHEYSIVNLKPANFEVTKIKNGGDEPVKFSPRESPRAITHAQVVSGRPNMVLGNRQRSVEVEANYSTNSNWQRKHEMYW